MKIGMPTYATKEEEVAAIAAALAHSGSTPLEFTVHDGQRILCLDGGGLKGLIMIEVLIRIEQLTQKKITELFDWIVGTSTGGVIALGLVYGEWSMHVHVLVGKCNPPAYQRATLKSWEWPWYEARSALLYCSVCDFFSLSLAKKSLYQLKQLYFEMKEDVFGSGNKYGYGFNTKKMEEVLKRNFGSEMTMMSVLEPK